MRADARAKRDQIVTAALAQIGTRPNSEITLEGIAADAGVGIATLYRHFPTRAALYDSCAIVFLERIETLLDDTLDGFEDNPVEHFESFVWALVESGVGILAATSSWARCNCLSTPPPPTASSPPASHPCSWQPSSS